MQKDLFDSYTKDIDVPKDEIMLAIDKGIKQGEKFRNNKKYKNYFKTWILY